MYLVDIKIRSSQVGKIMASSKDGTGLGETAKKYIQELFLEKEMGIKKDIWSRYFDKGRLVEKASIELANEVLKWELTPEYIHKDDQEYFENDWITGHTDICTETLLADVKSSWDATTFPFFKDGVNESVYKLNKDYYYQLQCYMWLSGHEKSYLVYCLVDTPEEILTDEIRREMWRAKSIDDDLEIEEMVRRKHNVEHIPKEFRVKKFTVVRDDDVIDKIKYKVMQCRAYYDSLFEIIGNQ
jgi:hypothetical protein